MSLVPKVPSGCLVIAGAGVGITAVLLVLGLLLFAPSGQLAQAFPALFGTNPQAGSGGAGGGATPTASLSPGTTGAPGTTTGPGATAAGSSISGSVPAISDRNFDSGTVHVTVGGELTLDADLELDVDKSDVSGGRAWLAYGSQGGDVVVLIVFHEPEDSAAVEVGTDVARGVDAQCSFHVQVTEALVSGHVSCPNAELLKAGEPAGTVPIELDFSAAT